MKYKWFFALVIILISLVMGYNYIYQDHRNIEIEKPEFVLTSEALISEFAANSTAAEKKYLNKTLEISGSISEINTSTLVLNNNVFCQFQNIISNTILTNEFVRLKGRCIGYDDLLEEIKLDQCSIIN